MDMTPDEIIAVVQAFKAGKEIELQPKAKEPTQWMLTTSPGWDFYHFNYRVRPEPKPDLIRYAHAWIHPGSGVSAPSSNDNLRLTFDGETGKLKSAEVLK
ncbi:MAG: hypothetical protein E6Q97_11380 [Desulfurellales bacterium]|nr:MAG: hypothetical protein E6Q97_11380 [Desulfurellales bacterium]